MNTRIITAHRFWLPAVLLAISPWFFVGGPEYSAAPLYRSLWDGGHILFFAALGFGLARSRRCRTARHWLIAGLLATLLGAGIEAVQLMIGRAFSWLDLQHDLAGFGLGALALAPANGRTWLLRGCAVLLTLPLLWKIVQGAQLQWRVYAQFPTIADFESGAETLRLSGQVRLQAQRVSHGQRALAIDLSTERYSGASIDRLLGDWRGYRFLAMEFHNPDPTDIPLTLRIADREHSRRGNHYHDRFNRRLIIPPGWSTVRLALADIEQAPRDRLLNLAEVTDITLFSSHTPSPRTLIWDYVRLE